MIRTPPQHNTKNLPGQIVYTNWEKPLSKHIEESVEDQKNQEIYTQGYKDGWDAAMNTKYPQPSSEAAR